MGVRFTYRKEKSPILGIIHRPIAQVFFWSSKDNAWSELWMIVDTGADYTLLPRFMADELGINLEKDCKVFSTFGVGGGEKVFFLRKIKVKLGNWEKNIPVGFLERNEIPPLLGRHQFLETFETVFSSDHTVSFSIPNTVPHRIYTDKEIEEFMRVDRLETEKMRKITNKRKARLRE